MTSETADAIEVRKADEVGEVYDAIDHEVLHFGYWDGEQDESSFEYASAHLTDLVLGHLDVSDGDRILDVGCGIGGPAVHLVETTAASVVGITISTSQVVKARNSAERHGVAGRVSFELADAMALPFADNSFDGAFALESIQHMDRPTALRELARVVKPGGHIVLTDLFRREPAPAGQESIMNVLVSMWSMSEPLALIDYPELARAAGLRDAEVTDISENVLRRSFADVLVRVTDAIDAGTAGSLYPKGALDLTLPENQMAVVSFTEQMICTSEIGYLVLAATVAG
ncbi:MAG TPA: methyltransferase domain-containing protein [Pseudonocardiaceae bacterium]|nr:methyltransferase domain-containing protein [Pseudonocardiaceae bacterium]